MDIDFSKKTSYYGGMKLARPYEREAKDFGIDLSILSSNLKKSPAERIIFHQKALSMMTTLKSHAQDIRYSKPTHSSVRK
jgi:hypothetical protein